MWVLTYNMRPSKFGRHSMDWIAIFRSCLMTIWCSTAGNIGSYFLAVRSSATFVWMATFNCSSREIHSRISLFSCNWFTDLYFTSSATTVYKTEERGTSNVCKDWQWPGPGGQKEHTLEAWVTLCQAHTGKMQYLSTAVTVSELAPLTSLASIFFHGKILLQAQSCLIWMNTLCQDSPWSGANYDVRYIHCLY